MIIAKKPLDLMKAHTAAGRSARRWVISQSSSIAHSVSQGPSRNACSALVSTGGFADMSFCQFGPPVNNSPSHQTVPASSASRSVEDMAGSSLRYFFMKGRVNRRIRSGRTLNRNRSAKGTESAAFHPVGAAPSAQYTASNTSRTPVLTARPARR